MEEGGRENWRNGSGEKTWLNAAGFKDGDMGPQATKVTPRSQKK